MEFRIIRLGKINIVMDSRYAIKRNQMRQRKLSTELENIHARLEGSLCLLEHEVKEVKKDQERQEEPDLDFDISYFKKRSETNTMGDARRRASSFSISESKTNVCGPKKPNLHERRESISKIHKIESPVAQYITSPLVPSYAKTRRMSLPANIFHSHEPFIGLHGSSSNSPGVNKGSDSSLKGSHNDVRRSRDSIRSRDSSPEMEKYECQMRRLKRELNQRIPKTIKQLSRIPLTSTEERHIIKYIKEEEHKQMTERKNAEILEGIQKCTYLRTKNPAELSVEEMLDRSPD
ncbi:uncharacterized protein LOC127732191 isoform X1 [Mytilus californianus]|uniref:uncharacterized protein LOC127732191 isoform X1 n=2 Tax=Mytilus californianus TaxID=6549 RepID=UPI0022480377|nr:uncharacterized protein LOC127732191 isoform X1 [Mytilus californianus]